MIRDDVSGRALEGYLAQPPKLPAFLFVHNRLEGYALGTTEAVIAGRTL